MSTELERFEAKKLALGFKPARAAPAPLLSIDEVREATHEAGLDWHKGWTAGEDAENRYLTLCRAVEAAVRAKLGVAVPMPGDQIFRIARRLAPKVIDGMVYVPEWIVPLVRTVEAHHGIMGKEGA